MHVAKHVGATDATDRRKGKHVGASHVYWDTKSSPMRPTCQSMVRPRCHPMCSLIPAGQDRGISAE